MIKDLQEMETGLLDEEELALVYEKTEQQGREKPQKRARREITTQTTKKANCNYKQETLKPGYLALIHSKKSVFCLESKIQISRLKRPKGSIT